MSMADDARALIMERKNIRSGAIAELLGCTLENVHEMLRPACEAGELVSCDVVVSGERLKEYRASGTDIVISKNSGRPPPPPKVAAFAFGRGDLLKKIEASPGAPLPDASSELRTAPPFQPKEKHAMNQKEEMIVDALKVRGPMNTEQLRAQFKHLRAVKVMGALVKAGHVVTLAGGADPVFGVKGQKLADWKGLIVGAPVADPKNAAKKAPAPKERAGAKRKKAGSAAARKAWKTRRAAAKAAAAPRAEAARAVQAGAFRPAIAADGALLLLGQATAGELSGPETRVLAAFLQKGLGA